MNKLIFMMLSKNDFIKVIKLNTLNALILLCFFFLHTKICISQSSQKKINSNKVIKYTLIRNTPETPNNLTIALSPLYLRVDGLNTSLNFCVEGNYIYKNRVGINLKYVNAFADGKLDGSATINDKGFSIYKPVSASSIELLGYYFFNSKTIEGTESVHMKFGSAGGIRTDYRLKVPAKSIRLVGLRLGYSSYYGIINSKNSNINFIGYNVDDVNKVTKEYSGFEYYDMMLVNTLSVGICKFDISDLLIKVEGYKKEKGVLENDELYFDVFYAPKIQFNDMYIADRFDPNNGGKAVSYSQYNVNENTKRTNLGFRLGYSVSVVDLSAYTLALELGYRPGPKVGFDNTFVILKAGFAFSTRLGKRN